MTHYRNSGGTSSEYSGLSLGLALLKYLATVQWLAKDVILLAADGETIGAFWMLRQKCWGY